MESHHLSHRRRDGDCSDPTAIRPSSSGSSLHTRLVNSLVPLLKKRASGEDRRDLAGSTFGGAGCATGLMFQTRRVKLDTRVRGLPR